MKKSKYNLFIPYKENSTIIFNTLYGTLGKLEDRIIDGYNMDSLSEDELHILYKQKIFVDDDIDELEIVNNNRIEGIMDTKRKVYRIWTTSCCNARCYYCFELGMERQTMTADTASKVSDYIMDQIKKGDDLRLEWFGGEPLLNTEVIEMISDKVIKRCEEINANFSASIITNGSLVDKTICKLFNDCRISRCQITLDGNKDVYNEAKNYCNKKYNFDLVINNIKLLSNNDIHVSVRLNYDNKNYNSLSELLDYLYDNFRSNKNVSSYIYPIWSSTYDNKFITEAYADDKYIKLVDKMVKYNMTKAENVIGLKRKVRSCSARNINSVAILPDGRFSKCSEAFNQIIGNLDKGVTDTKTYNEWTTVNLDEGCKECVYLPVCNGGCQAARYTNMEICFPTKNIHDDIVRWYINYLDNKQGGE